MTDPTGGEAVYSRTADVVCRQVGRESILVPITRNVGDLDFIYTLSPVAARIWALFDGKRTVDQIVDAICDEYSVNREQAVGDVADLVSDLRRVSLILQVT